MLDAKLVRSAKARAVAQIGFYSDLLAGVQGIRPRWMHLAPGSGEFSPLKVDDYAAYKRQARRLLTAFTANDDGENPPTQIWAFDRQADTDPQKRAASATLLGFTIVRITLIARVTVVAGAAAQVREWCWHIPSLMSAS